MLDAEHVCGADRCDRYRSSLLITRPTAHLSCAGKLLLERSFRFDDELGAYGTTGGVHYDKENNDALRVTAPSLMFVEALDRILGILQRDESVDLSKVVASDGVVLMRSSLLQLRAISGSAQQHGSVYWAEGAERLLNSLEQQPEVPLHQQLAHAFAIAGVNSSCFGLRLLMRWCRWSGVDGLEHGRGVCGSGARARWPAGRR